MKNKKVKIEIDVHKPIKGVDYFTDSEVASIKNDIVSGIKIPQAKEVDYKKIDSLIANKIPKFDIKPLVKDTKKLEENIEELKESYKEIKKDLKGGRYTQTRVLNSAGPTTRLGDLVDVNAEGAAGNVLTKQSDGTWSSQAPAPSDKAYADLTDVDMTGLADGNMAIWDADTSKWIPAVPTDTDEKVKYDATDPTAGYISDKFVAGTGISLAEGTGGNENKLVITNTLDLSNYLETGDNISLLTNDAGYLTAESDTLQSVTNRGATTTNNLTVSNSNPKLIVSSTATDSPKAWLEKLTTFDGAQLVSQGRRFAPANAISILGTAGTMANQPSLGAFFVSTWLWSDGSSFQSLFSNGTNNIQLRGQSVSPPYIRVAGFGGSTVDFFAVSGQPALVGRWTHVVVGRNGSGQWSVWYDGVASPQNGSSCGSTTHSSFTVPITTNGDVDETIIYNIAPTQSLVNGLYNSGVPTRITDYTNVVAHWSADQSSGTTLTDNSGNGRNITGITGATWITGIVSSNVLQSLTDIPILKIQNNGIAGSYGTLTHGWYETTRGTTNIYDGLSHQFNYLGSSKMTLGSGGVSLALANGTLAAPSLYFNNSSGTGIYSDSAGVMRHVTAGTLRLTVYNTAILASVPFYGQNGSATAPTYSISADTNTGWYSGGADIINFTTGGAYRGQIDSAGRQAWGNTTSSAIFARYSSSPTQLTTGTTVGQFEGTHTQNADNALGFVGNVSNVGLNTAGFNNTVSLNSGGGLSGFYGLVQVSSTPATGTVTSIQGARMSVRNNGAGIITDVIGFHAMPILNTGAGSITNAYGFYAGVMASATNNYSFYGVTTAATGRWNIYMAGSANNYMSGALNIGNTTVDSKFKVETSGSLVGVKIQGATGFTGDLTQWIDVASATVMASVDKLGVMDATSYKVGGVAGFTGTGAYTNFTIVGGIITAAS